MPAIINADAETKAIVKGKFSNTSLNKKELVKRANAMQTEGSTWIATWQDLSDYIYPTKGFFHSTTPNQGSKIDHKKLIDSHATLAVDIMASGMLSGLTSPSRPWFKLGLADHELMEFAPVKIWLETCARILMETYQKSNIYGMLNLIYTEIATFGTACAYLEESFQNVLRARNYTAGEYFLSTDENGTPNAFYRRFWMTTGQIIKRFGLENASSRVQQQYRSNTPDIWNIVNHLIEVNDARIPFLKDYSNMSYRSAYWEDGVQDDNYLKIGGYEEFPILAPRWDVTTTADSYGKGPGWKALGDIKMLQKLQKNKLIALDKLTNPPLQVDSSVVGEVNTLPGGITRFSAQTPNAGVKPTYQVNIDLVALEQTIKTTKDAIGRYFFTDLFLMLIEADRNRREMTATEIIERQAEKLSMLGPVLERLENELLNPMIERSFNLADRLGVLPPPPTEIQGMELKIQYISVLAQAQKMVGITVVDQWSAGVVNDASIDPTALDIINFDEKNRAKADMLGVPAKIINTPEEVAARRKARAKAAAEAEAQNKMMLLAEGAAKGAGAVKSMADSPMGQNSALDATLGIMQKAQQ